MAKHRLVISVTGGVVEDVLTDAPELEVILCDWDVDAVADPDIPQVVQVRNRGSEHACWVAPFATAPLPSSPYSLVGAALLQAGFADLPQRQGSALSDRELATVLAALRYWQNDLAVDGVESVIGGAHFQEHEPLNVDEIDGLCEQFNRDGDGPSEQCECQQPGCFHSGVPGILAHAEAGQAPPDAGVERCDLCQLYPSDAEARVELARLGIIAATT
jgi:hypothetical protein